MPYNVRASLEVRREGCDSSPRAVLQKRGVDFRVLCITSHRPASPSLFTIIVHVPALLTTPCLLNSAEEVRLVREGLTDILGFFFIFFFLILEQTASVQT
jgi:hypothetical protein